MPFAKERPIRVLLLGAIGALSFWAPDLLLHWLIRMYKGIDWFWILTLTLPATFAAAYLFTGSPKEKGFKHIGVAMLLGVWCTGGLFILLEWSLLGGPALTGGFQNKLMEVMLSVFPPVTFFYSAYDGSLSGLLLLTVGSALFWGIRAGIAR
jgi:hypothetical protein